jgi:hypothetical protein
MGAITQVEEDTMPKLPPIVVKSVSQASGSPDVWSKIAVFIQAAKAMAADGLTLKEFAQLTLELVKLSVESAATLNVAGADKREIVLDGVGRLFDALADQLVPFWAKPIWLMLRPSVRSAVLAAAAGAIDYILTNRGAA